MNADTAINAFYPIHYHGAVGLYDTLTEQVTMMDCIKSEQDKQLLKEYGDELELLGLC